MLMCKNTHLFFFGWQLLNIAIKSKLLVISFKNTNCRSKIIEFYAKVKISEIIDQDNFCIYMRSTLPINISEPILERQN